MIRKNLEIKSGKKSGRGTVALTNSGTRWLQRGGWAHAYLREGGWGGGAVQVAVPVFSSLSALRPNRVIQVAVIGGGQRRLRRQVTSVVVHHTV